MPQEPQQAKPQAPSPAPPKKFYLTTPIYYVNARPHIGHAYTTIVADVLARRHRLGGDHTFFLTGTDEHGQKIERSAAAAGIPPQQFADGVSRQFQDLWNRMGITYNRYIRTTDPAHKQGAQKLFRELYNNGQIYLSTYTGQYSIGEEMFVDGPPGTLGPDGRLTETVTEENFFFRLSDFQLPLLELIESNTLRVTPESARNEVHAFLTGNVRDLLKAHGSAKMLEKEDGSGVIFDIPEDLFEKGILARTQFGVPYVPGALKDLSISRSSFTWGIPVPEDIQQSAGATHPHIIYVWLDALANYITAIGYGSDDPAKQEEFKKYWPADLHLVGKEITRFHCVYWPAFLLALNPALQQPPQNAVILSEARSAQPKDPERSESATEAQSFQPQTPNATPATLLNEAHTVWAKDWLPKQITANGWLLFDNAKMSKSRGNVVRTETILDAFGDHVYGKQFPDSTKRERDLFAADVLRYFLLREIPFGQDGSFTFDALVTRYNADLANGYGNLVSRTLKLISSALSDDLGAPPTARFAFYEGDENGEGIKEEVWFVGESATNSSDIEGLPLGDYITKLYAKGDLYGVARDISSFVRIIDGFISANEPWRRAKSIDSQARAELERTLYTAAEAIRIITLLLYPILPYTTAKVWQQLGLGDIALATSHQPLATLLQWGGLQPGTKLGPLGPIFPRADKSLIQVMLNMEEARTLPIQEAAAIPMTTEAALPTAKAAESLAGEKMPTTQDTQPSSDPAAPPRTSSLDEPSGTLTVAGSAAQKPTLPTTPGPHTAAPASGLFAQQPTPTPKPQSPIPDPRSPTPDPQSPPPEITIDDFLKIDLRVAQILTAERIPKADKLLRLEVDLGPLGKRQILSGIAGHYAPEELLGRRIAVVANLLPRKMRGLDSHGMLLAASNPEEGPDGKPILATFTEDIPLGSRVR